MRRRNNLARTRGALAVLNVISREREKNFIENDYVFPNSGRARIMDPVTEPRRTQTSSAFTQIDIRHSLAAVIEKPKRSLIFVWHTGEEKGLWGAYYFAAHSPIPLEKISAQLNMDMLSRNDPQSIYLIGSRKLSSELDAAIHAVNDKYLFFNLDYKYENPGHPDRFFFRSDQYPYIRYGIPAAWFFCGTTEDYHQETDTVDRVDFDKMERVTKLVYLTALEIGNRDSMLKLDIHPEVTSRGKHNHQIDWRKQK